jgi:hypothetical protein
MNLSIELLLIYFKKFIKMVFYIVSCYKENESEKQIENIINGNVL